MDSGLGVDKGGGGCLDETEERFHLLDALGDTVCFKLTGAPIPHVAFDSGPVVEGWEQFGFTCRFYQQLGAQGRGTGSSITANEELVTLMGDVDNLRRKQDLLDSFEGIGELLVPDNCFLA